MVFHLSNSPLVVTFKANQSVNNIDDLEVPNYLSNLLGDISKDCNLVSPASDDSMEVEIAD